MDLTTALVNIILAAKIEELFLKQYNLEFPETHYEEKKEMSQDDKRFMEIVSDQVVKIDGHYSLPLPFRNDDVKMTNNREMAFQRAKGLVKRMKRDENYHREYTEFTEKLLLNDYAEKVSAEQVHIEEGNVWFIPHHGVYHKRKKT